MSMNETPSGERIHIGFFGRRNAGKSSLVNAITNQDLSVVSAEKGTTTDPVLKSMELLPLGPVVIIDTPGFDDEGQLGELRVQRARQTLNKADVALLVVDAGEGLQACDLKLLKLIRERELPYILAFNKCETLTDASGKEKLAARCSELGIEQIAFVSAQEKTGLTELKEKIGHLSLGNGESFPLVADLIQPNELVILVIPIDSAAPKGRIILPQQQVLRDVLEAGGVGLCVRDTELAELLEQLKPKKPGLVITDSQAFATVSRIVPEEIPLTSFSILMARRKGFLEPALEAVKAIENLEEGDHILISEGCTHHRQCDDIGTFKIPNWLKNYSGKTISFETSSGRGFPEDLSPYKLVIHCGGCMLNEKEVLYRMKCAKGQGVPFMNYGITIAYMNGILERCTRMLKKKEKDEGTH